jgi:DNA polymerase-4
MEKNLPRIVLHLDMDAFYAAVEVREDPALTGKPLIIGHEGRRGVVSTCSYEARKFGVHSAMPSVTARKLCPDAVWRPGRMSLYQQISRRIRTIMGGFTPVVEPLSIDEAFLDMTGIVFDLEGGAEKARQLKAAIQKAEGLSSSVGISPNKFLAKFASDLRKPDGLVILGKKEIPSMLWPMPVQRLWGVGPRTAERLNGLALRRIGDIVACPRQRLVSRLGASSADHLLALARGEDFRPVQAAREARSSSEERTYSEDIRSPEIIEREFLARAEGVARSLRDEGLAGWTVNIKVRTGDFTTWTRSVTLPAPTCLTEEIHESAMDLFSKKIELKGKGIRLLGVGLSNLEPMHPSLQPELFPDEGKIRFQKSAAVEDEVRHRFGESAITRARLIRKKESGEASEASSLPAVD